VINIFRYFYSKNNSNFARVADLLQKIWVALQQKIKLFYQHLINNHKKSKIALVDFMCKLLSFIHAILKYKLPWKSYNLIFLTLITDAYIILKI